MCLDAEQEICYGHDPYCGCPKICAGRGLSDVLGGALSDRAPAVPGGVPLHGAADAALVAPVPALQAMTS